MPYIMLNGKQYGGNGGNYQVAKMSKADYDALTTEQKNDGTLRIVVDSAGNSVNYMSETVAGAKCDDTLTNLLNPTLATTTINNVDITNNGDGTYTCNGTSTSQPNAPLCTITGVSGRFKLLGCPSGGGVNEYNLSYQVDGTWSGTYEIGDGLEIELESNKTYTFHLVVRSGKTLNNVVFKPMLTPCLTATYDDFVGYTGGTGRLNSDVALHQRQISRINTDLSESETIIATTFNSTYINSSYVKTIEFGNIVIVSGRFTVNTAKPTGQSNWLFRVPAPKGVIVPVCETSSTLGLIVNESGYLTSNNAIPASTYNIFVAYVK